MPLEPRTHCPHGHPLDGTKSNGKGKPRKRCCNTCRSRINRENYLKRKARRQAREVGQ